VGRILLLGYFGADNLGDDGLLADFLLRWQAQLRATETTCDVVSTDSQPLRGFAEAPALQPLLGQTVVKQSLLLSNPKDYTALVAPGGSLLQDVTSRRSLAFYLLVIKRFARAGVPIYLLNQGLGPLRSFMSRYFTAQTLSLTRMLSVRDSDSYGWLKDQLALTSHRELYHSADPLLGARLQAAPPPFTGEYCLLIPKSTSRRSELDPAQVAYLRGLADMVDALGADCFVLPFHGGQDALLAEAVLADSAAQRVPETLLGPEPKTGTLGLLAGAGMVISYRLHGVILASAYRVPAFGVAYDPKVSAFCGEMGLPWASPGDFHKGKAKRQLEELWQNRQIVSNSLELRRRAALERAERADRRLEYLLWGRR
jgi:polysaccharide pyruvyl transferase CsaB